MADALPPAARRPPGTPGPELRRLRVAGVAAFPGFRLRVLARTESTQDLIRAAARRGAPEGLCVAAAEQTAGRGRDGRAWVAAPGTALLVSVLLRPQRRALTLLPLATGVAVCEAVRRSAGVEARLKWPNDVVAGGGKLAGILCEAGAGGEGDRAAVAVGLGLNLRQDGAPPGVRAASLDGLGAAGPAWPEVLAEFLTALARWSGRLDAGETAAVLEAWRRHAAGLGATVRVATPAGEVRGIACGVDTDGALLVDSGAGVVRVVAGDAHLI